MCLNKLFMKTQKKKKKKATLTRSAQLFFQRCRTQIEDINKQLPKLHQQPYIITRRFHIYHRMQPLKPKSCNSSVLVLFFSLSQYTHTYKSSPLLFLNLASGLLFKFFHRARRVNTNDELKIIGGELIMCFEINSF